MTLHRPGARASAPTYELPGQISCDIDSALNDYQTGRCLFIEWKSLDQGTWSLGQRHQWRTMTYGGPTHWSFAIVVHRFHPSPGQWLQVRPGHVERFRVANGHALAGPVPDTFRPDVIAQGDDADWWRWLEDWLPPTMAERMRKGLTDDA